VSPGPRLTSTRPRSNDCKHGSQSSCRGRSTATVRQPEARSQRWGRVGARAGSLLGQQECATQLPRRKSDSRSGLFRLPASDAKRPSRTGLLKRASLRETRLQLRSRCVRSRFFVQVHARLPFRRSQRRRRNAAATSLNSGIPMPWRFLKEDELGEYPWYWAVYGVRVHSAGRS